MGLLWFVLGWNAAQAAQNTQPMPPIAYTAIGIGLLGGVVLIVCMEVGEWRRVAREKAKQQADIDAWERSDKTGPPPSRCNWVLK